MSYADEIDDANLAGEFTGCANTGFVLGHAAQGATLAWIAAVVHNAPADTIDELRSHADQMTSQDRSVYDQGRIVAEQTMRHSLSLLA